MEETRLIGDLPNMRVEITHRQVPDGSAEQMVIQLTATPDFQSAGRMLGQLGPMPVMMAMAQIWMAPFQALANPFLSGNPFLSANPFLSLGRPDRAEKK